MLPLIEIASNVHTTISMITILNATEKDAAETSTETDGMRHLFIFCTIHFCVEVIKLNPENNHHRGKYHSTADLLFDRTDWSIRLHDMKSPSSWIVYDVTINPVINYLSNQIRLKKPYHTNKWRRFFLVFLAVSCRGRLSDRSVMMATTTTMTRDWKMIWNVFFAVSNCHIHVA